jgi:hypothetical protein
VEKKGKRKTRTNIIVAVSQPFGPLLHAVASCRGVGVVTIYRYFDVQGWVRLRLEGSPPLPFSFFPFACFMNHQGVLVASSCEIGSFPPQTSSSHDTSDMLPIQCLFFVSLVGVDSVTTSNVPIARAFQIRPQSRKPRLRVCGCCSTHYTPHPGSEVLAWCSSGCGGWEGACVDVDLHVIFCLLKKLCCQSHTCVSSTASKVCLSCDWNVILLDFFTGCLEDPSSFRSLLQLPRNNDSRNTVVSNY